MPAMVSFDKELRLEKSKKPLQQKRTSFPDSNQERNVAVNLSVPPLCFENDIFFFSYVYSAFKKRELYNSTFIALHRCFVWQESWFFHSCTNSILLIVWLSWWLEWIFQFLHIFSLIQMVYSFNCRVNFLVLLLCYSK